MHAPSNTPTTIATEALVGARLANFPVAFFSIVMGLSGLTLALRRAVVVLALPAVAADAAMWLTAAVFAAIALFYLAKLIRHPGAVRAEFRHPVKMSFAATASVSLVLLGTIFLHSLPTLSLTLWSVGAALHLAFTLYVLNEWLHQDRFEINHISPAWFIPVVGNILVPIAGVAHGAEQLSWFSFSVGALFWLVLFTIIMYRMIFHHPLPARLLPTLFILIAPPAVGFVAYLQLTGGLDAFGRVLYFSALFMTLLLAMQLPRFLRLRFYLSWWAYSFPMGAMTTASLAMAQLQPDAAGFRVLAWLLLGILTLLIAALTVRTVLAIRRREICVEEQ